MEEAMNTQPQLIEFPEQTAKGSSTLSAVPDGAGESLLGSDTRPRNYGDEPRREDKPKMWRGRPGESTHSHSAEMPNIPTTSSEMERRLDYAVGGFFLGCCVMVGAYILGILAWRSM